MASQCPEQRQLGRSEGSMVDAVAAGGSAAAAYRSGEKKRSWRRVLGMMRKEKNR
jgi:hypothetical protein